MELAPVIPPPSQFLFEPALVSKIEAESRVELQSTEGSAYQGGAFVHPACIQAAISGLVKSKNYPCVPAMLSLQNREYMVGIYSDFGSGAFASSLLRDLKYFRARQKASKALYLSFWAIFGGQAPSDESSFEEGLWRELSVLSDLEGPDKKWDPNFSSNPEDPNFCVSVDGEAFFVVGLHAKASRQARQFPWPSVVFNLYEQFEELDRSGKYESTVKLNRAREMKFAGSLNPMVEDYGDKWEAIQFSGKSNPSTWKCPFAHLSRT